MDEALTLAVIAELATQPVHRHAHHVARWGIVEAPDVLRYSRGGYD